MNYAAKNTSAASPVETSLSKAPRSPNLCWHPIHHPPLLFAGLERASAQECFMGWAGFGTADLLPSPGRGCGS